MYVRHGGSVSIDGNRVSYDHYGVRPAMWIDLSGAEAENAEETE